MKSLDILFKLAQKFELIIKDEDNQSDTKKLLQAALKANEGYGIQIYFKGQHFGWYKWNADKKKHEQFSIDNFSPKDSIGKLEKEVGKLAKVSLEDFLPTIAGRKQV